MSEFNPIPGWPGYEISNSGILVSYRTNGGKVSERKKVREPSRDEDGYLRVKLHSGRKTVFVGIHKLVLMAFIGPQPPGNVVRHLNGIRDDNRLSNLAWGTPEENYQDREDHGNTARYEKNGRAKIDRSVVERILQLRENGMPYEKIGITVSLSKRQVMRICKGESWKGVLNQQGN